MQWRRSVVKYGGRVQSGQAIKLFIRRLEKLVFIFHFDTSLSSLQSYAAIVLNERMRHFMEVKTYSDPSYIFSGGQDPSNPQVLHGGTSILVSSPLHIWGLSPVLCGLTSVNLTFGYIFFSNYRAQDRSERHHFIRALYKFIYVDGRTRSSARGDLAVQRTRTVRRRTCIRRRRSGSMEPVAVLRSQLSASVDSFMTALNTFSVHCQYSTVPYILSLCCCMHCMISVVYGALESVTVLRRTRNYRYINITLRAKISGAVYCNRSCLWVCLCVCLCVGLLPR